MGFKEILTYVLTALGIGLICYVRVCYSQRQKVKADGMYNKKEQQTQTIAVVILGIALVLALIPIY